MHRGAIRSALAPAAIAGTGTLLACVAGWFWVTTDLFTVGSAPVKGEVLVGLRIIEAVLMTGSSLTLIGAGLWLATSDFTDEQRWWVMSWSVIGVIGIVTLIALLQAHQLSEGLGLDPRTILEEMLMGAGGGGIAGLLIGLGTAQSMRHAEHVARQRDAFAFLNKLLRHNILNGINLIQGRAALLADEADDDHRTHLHSIEDRSESIADLTRNVRDMARVLSGEATLEPVDLSEILRMEVETARLSFEEAVFETDIPDGVTVRANQALAGVFDNLLTNAVEHNDADLPRVAVSVTTSDERIRVRIADNGPGVPDDRKDSIFEPNDHGDHGMGLFLVKTLVNCYEGEVRLEDKDPTGSVFTVTLPAA